VGWGVGVLFQKIQIMSAALTTTSDQKYTLTRKEAVELSGLSVRTLDRYIKKGKLDYLTVGEGSRRILINQKSLEDLVRSLGDVTVRNVAQKKVSAGVGESHAEAANIYEKLYSEAQTELKEARQRLEGANYRVGELEAKLKSTIPLLEYEKAQKENKRLISTVSELEVSVSEISRTKQQIELQAKRYFHSFSEERKKHLFYASLFGLLAVGWSFVFILQGGL
jgi:hypothetical protein